MLKVIYRYIIHPRETITHANVPFAAAFLVVILASLASSMHLIESDLMGRWMPHSRQAITGLAVIVGIVIWGIRTAIIEFLAQFMGHTAPRLVLFTWLGMAQAPAILSIPLGVLALVSGRFTILFTVPIAILPVVTKILEVITIKQVYRVSTLRGIFLLILPYLAVGTIVVGILLWLGLSFW